MHENITFLFHVYNEFDLAERLIKQIKLFFPENQVICLADGISNQQFETLCLKNNIKYIQGTRLFRHETGVEWIKRFFFHFLANSKNNYLLKIDPDAYILRPFKYLPKYDISGTPYNLSNGITFIQGGCTLYSRHCAERILLGPELFHPKYRNSIEYGYCRFKYPYKKDNEKSEDYYFTCEDRILGDLAPKLNLSLGKWDELYCTMQEQNPNDFKNKEVAIIHQVKKL